MSKPKNKVYYVTLSVTLEVSPSVIRRGRSKSFAESFYQLDSDEEVAGHLAYNLAQGRNLSSLDGWGDMKDSLARVSGIDVVEAEESCE